MHPVPAHRSALKTTAALTGVSGLVIACSPGNSRGSPLLVPPAPPHAGGSGGTWCPATLLPRLL